MVSARRFVGAGLTESAEAAAPAEPENRREIVVELFTATASADGCDFERILDRAAAAFGTTRDEILANTKDSNGYTLVHAVAAHGNLSLLLHLLSSLPNPLPEASAHDDAPHTHTRSLTQVLLGRAKKTGETPVHRAANCGHLPVVKALLDFQARANGCSPAAVQRCFGLVDKRLQRHNHSRNGPLVFPLAKSAEPVLRPEEAEKVMRALAVLKDQVLSKCHENERTALHMALFEGETFRFLAALLDLGENAWDKDEGGTLLREKFLPSRLRQIKQKYRQESAAGAAEEGGAPADLLQLSIILGTEALTDLLAFVPVSVLLEESRIRGHAPGPLLLAAAMSDHALAATLLESLFAAGVSVHTHALFPGFVHNLVEAGNAQALTLLLSALGEDKKTVHSLLSFRREEDNKTVLELLDGGVASAQTLGEILAPFRKIDSDGVGVADETADGVAYEKNRMQVGSNDGNPEEMMKKVEEGLAEANEFKTEANKKHACQDYAKASELYTEGLEIMEALQFPTSIASPSSAAEKAEKEREKEVEARRKECRDLQATLAANLADSELRRGNVRGGLEAADLAIILRPNWWKGYLRRGTLLQFSGECENAITAYNAACLRAIEGGENANVIAVLQQHIRDAVNEIRAQNCQ